MSQDKVRTFTDISLTGKLDMMPFVTEVPDTFRLLNDNAILPCLVEIKGKHVPRIKDLKAVKIEFIYTDTRTNKKITLFECECGSERLSIGKINNWIKSALKKRFAGPFNSDNFKQLFQSHYKTDPYRLRPSNFQLVIKEMFYHDWENSMLCIDLKGCQLTKRNEWD